MCSCKTHYIRCYAERLRNWLIMLLGGDNPVTVQYLKYRAKLLAGMIPTLTAPTESYRTLVAAQAKAINEALTKLDHAR